PPRRPKRLRRKLRLLTKAKKLKLLILERDRKGLGTQRSGAFLFVYQGGGKESRRRRRTAEKSSEPPPPQTASNPSGSALPCDCVRLPGSSRADGWSPYRRQGCERPGRSCSHAALR